MLTKILKSISMMNNTALEDFKQEYNLLAQTLSKTSALEVEIAIKNREKQLRNHKVTF